MASTDIVAVRPAALMGSLTAEQERWLEDVDVDKQRRLAAKAAELELAIARERAKVASRIIEEKKLYTVIKGKKYVHYEGWLILARQYNFTPSIDPSQSGPLPEGGYRAVAVLSHPDHPPVVASAVCGTPQDGDWSQRDENAQQSMAQTRAIAKASRLALSWVMVLGGYAAMPAEEMGVAAPAPGRAQIKAATQFEYEPSECPKCGSPWRYVPAGVSKTGQLYSAFHACSKRGCDGRPDSVKALHPEAVGEAPPTEEQRAARLSPQRTAAEALPGLE